MQIDKRNIKGGRFMKKVSFSGKKLFKVRKDLKLSANDVVGVLWEMGHKKASIQLLRNYEMDKNVPGLEYAVSLAAIYKCDVKDFTK